MSDRVLFIAEAGVNHNGSLDLAKRLVDAAVAAGADIVKFQSFRAASLATAAAKKAQYQEVTTGAAESQFDMLKKLELPRDHHLALVDHCRASGIEFLSTPFDRDSLRFLLENCGLRRLKLGSGDLTNAPLVLDAARSGLPLILSSGMATLEEIETALGVAAFGYLEPKGKPSRAAFTAAFASPAGRKALAEKVTMLQCVTEYPAPHADLNLRVVPALRERFGIRAGFSDHSLGLSACLAAVAVGAQVIEKHFTLDRNMEGPDHRASLEPAELRDLVRGVREVEAALGDGRKRPVASEEGNRKIARRSLVAGARIRKGEPFTEQNVDVKRPESGVSPLYFWDLLGTPATRDYEPDEPLEKP